MPDMADWHRERELDLPDTAYFPLAPDWVCEVLSAPTRRLDLHGKRPVYAREIVRHLRYTATPGQRGVLTRCTAPSRTRSLALRRASPCAIARGSGRGLSLTLVPVIGAVSSAVERLWSARDAKALSGHRDFDAHARLTAEAGCRYRPWSSGARCGASATPPGACGCSHAPSRRAAPTRLRPDQLYPRPTRLQRTRT